MGFDRVTGSIEPVSSDFVKQRVYAIEDAAQATYVTPEEVSAQYEPKLSNPDTDGKVLASTAAGVRSWVTMGAGSGTSDHGALTGLADDDHTQYHTDARGDARYSQLGHTHDYATSSHTHDYAATSHAHAGVYEPADATILKDADIGVSVAAQSHTHDYAATSHTHDYAAASHNHDASAINAGTMATARLGSGTASSSTFLRGDQTWATPAGSGEAFPVGAVFLSVVSTNPNTLLGYGTWSQIAGGRVLVGQTGSDTDFDTAEETGGSKTSSAVVNHTHDVTVTDPGHTHLTQRYPTATGSSSGFTIDTSMSGTPTDNTLATKSNTTGITASTANPSGGVASFSLMNPYFVVYIWKRTA